MYVVDYSMAIHVEKRVFQELVDENCREEPVRFEVQ